jgi:hypothetical protein
MWFQLALQLVQGSLGFVFHIGQWKIRPAKSDTLGACRWFRDVLLGIGTQRLDRMVKDILDFARGRLGSPTPLTFVRIRRVGLQINSGNAYVSSAAWRRAVGPCS